MLKLLSSMFLAIILSALPSGASACSCVKRTLEQQFNESSFVFVGKVIDKREVKSRTSQPGWGGWAAKVSVAKAIKGEPRLLPGVESGYGQGDCGIRLLVNASYIFFANAEGDVNICSGTQTYIQGLEPHEQVLNRIEALRSHAR